jgi:hypothetical protein
MTKTTTPPPRPLVGILPAESGTAHPAGTRGIANAGIIVQILPNATPAMLRAMAAELRDMATQMEAPPGTPRTDAAFLGDLLRRVEARERVSLTDVARLRRLADWADAPPCVGWDGTLDVEETRRGVADARRRVTGDNAQ